MNIWKETGSFDLLSFVHRMNFFQQKRTKIRWRKRSSNSDLSSIEYSTMMNPLTSNEPKRNFLLVEIRFQLNSSSNNQTVRELLEKHLDEIFLTKAYIPPQCRSVVAKCRELLGADVFLAHHQTPESHSSCYASCLPEGDSVMVSQAFVWQCMRKFQHLSIWNRRLFWLLNKTFNVAESQRMKFINQHQTEVLAVFQQSADGIFQSQWIQSNLHSLHILLFKTFASHTRELTIESFFWWTEEFLWKEMLFLAWKEKI